MFDTPLAYIVMGSILIWLSMIFQRLCWTKFRFDKEYVYAGLYFVISLAIFFVGMALTYKGMGYESLFH